jgi:hypothetical protein
MKAVFIDINSVKNLPSGTFRVRFNDSEALSTAPFTLNNSTGDGFEHQRVRVPVSDRTNPPISSQTVTLQLVKVTESEGSGTDELIGGKATVEVAYDSEASAKTVTLNDGVTLSLEVKYFVFQMMDSLRSPGVLHGMSINACYLNRSDEVACFLEAAADNYPRVR